MKCSAWRLAAAAVAGTLGFANSPGFAQEPAQSRPRASLRAAAAVHPLVIAPLLQEEPQADDPDFDPRDAPIPAPDFDPREAPVPAPEFDPREAPPRPEPPRAEPAPERLPRPVAAPAVEPAEAEPDRLFPQDGLINVHGWWSGGLTFNGRGTSDRFNGPVTFNDRRGEFLMNQLYAVIERPLEAECGIDIGGRMDLLFGTDYIFTQSAGLETRRDFDRHWNSSRFYGLAMPQLFGELGNRNVSLKLGHFYTIIGYEVVPAPDNFFYSHAYTMQYGEPFTHTGGLATWHYNDRWTFTGGIVDGWDKFDPVTSRASFLGGAAYTPDHEQYSLAFSLITGEEDGAAPPVEGNRTMYSLVFSSDLTERWKYVLQHDHGIQSLDAGGTTEWYGINQYLFYTLSDSWKAGVRAEWFRDDDGVRVAGVRPGNDTPGGHSGSFYNITLGLNWSPNANLIVRPETRWDWFDGTNASAAPYDGHDDQFTVGIDAVLLW